MKDRKSWKDKLAGKQEQSYKDRNDSGRFKPIFLGFPENIKFWKCNEGEHTIDIVPYEAGPNDPKNKKGEPTYKLDIFVHNKVGANEDSYVCMNRTYGKPCPICEHKLALSKKDDFDEAEVKELNPKRRVIYNVWVHDSTNSEAMGIQLMNMSHFLFEKELLEASKKPKGGGFIHFANYDKDSGKNITFDRKGSGAMNTKFSPFHFFDREEDIPDEILEKALSLDQYLHIPTYEEVYASFHSTTMEEEVPVEEEEYEETEKEDVTEEEDPVEARKKAREERLKKQASEDPCPQGHVFGVDVDKFDECEPCKKWDECNEKSGELVKPVEKKEPAKKTALRRPGK
jgi:hypothetical protein